MAIQKGNAVCVRGCPKKTSPGLEGLFNFHVQETEMLWSYLCDIYNFLITLRDKKSKRVYHFKKSYFFWITSINENNNQHDGSVLVDKFSKLVIISISSTIYHALKLKFLYNFTLYENSWHANQVLIECKTHSHNLGNGILSFHAFLSCEYSNLFFHWIVYRSGYIF